MAKVSAHGTVLLEYFSTRQRGLMRYMSDGTILYRTPFTRGWKVYGTKKKDVDDTQWRAYVAQREAKVLALPAWTRKIKTLPSMETLEQWRGDSVVESVTGYTVEPDGRGPDGAPSWLLALGLI